MSKEQLELEKLRLEVAKLKVPLLKNIEFWKILIPAVAIVVSLYFTFGKGMLDSEAQKLEIQKEQLKLEILQFEQEKSNIVDSISVKDVERKELAKLINNYRNTRDSLIASVRRLNSQTSSLKVENERIKSGFSKDAEFYKKEIKKRFDEGRKSEKRVGVLSQQLDDKAVKEAGLNAQIGYFEKKVKLNPTEKLELDIERLNAESKVLDAVTKRMDESGKKIMEDLKKTHKEIDTMSADELIRRLELEIIERTDEDN